MTAVVATLAGTAAGLWAAALVAVRRNHRAAPSVDDEGVAGPTPDVDDAPSVCVVVPARDEEQNIGACLASLLRSDHPRLRVRVVDDASIDRTADIVSGIALADPRVELLRLSDLPDGWLGKNHALWRGAAGVDAEWLLFVDADLRVEPRCIARAVATARRLGADLLTIVPRFDTPTFWETAVQTVIAHAIVTTLDVRAVNAPASARAAAIGPFLLFRREAYERIGGHRAVRGAVVEDLRLAEAVKRAGLRLVLARGTRSASLRMYDSLSAIVRGWSKNLHVAIDGRPWLLPPAIALIVLLYATPWIAPIWGLARRDAAAAAAGGLALALSLAARVDLRRLYGVTARRPYLAPLGALVVAWILTRSVVLAYRRAPVEWRRRSVVG